VGQKKPKKIVRLPANLRKNFFDGDRRHGYGGFSYNPRFWYPVVPTFQDFYKLSPESFLFDVGCAKGFMLNDFSSLIPGLNVCGVDVSKYAIEHGKREIKDRLQICNATELPYSDQHFDLVFSINTFHNLHNSELDAALGEI
jgi:SAM-dependent methyltransferase